MTDRAIDVYLNDHLAGATLGADLAAQVRSHAQGTSLGHVMESVAPQIDEDRQSLIDLMERLGVSKNPVKQAGAWLTEKASRVKFSGVTSGDSDLGTFMALESLVIGVQGKLSLWQALAQVADRYTAINAAELHELINRADSQYAALEHERLVASVRVLSRARAMA